jgi:hypothetical protein
MKFPTEIWVRTLKRPDLPVFQFRNGNVALTINKEEHLGYYYNGVMKWYFGGFFLSYFIESRPMCVTLPRINVIGSDQDILKQIQSYARRLIGFTYDSTGDYPEGTLYLIDLYGQSDSVRGTSSFDVALVISTALFDWTGARKVPDYLGWTGLEVPDLPERPRNSRYKRDPVI